MLDSADTPIRDTVIGQKLCKIYHLEFIAQFEMYKIHHIWWDHPNSTHRRIWSKNW